MRGGRWGRAGRRLPGRGVGAFVTLAVIDFRAGDEQSLFVTLAVIDFRDGDEQRQDQHGVPLN